MDFSIDPGSAAIAALALFVSVHSAWETRQHSRLSVRPRLTTFTSKDAKRYGDEVVTSVAVLLSNSGLGPAVIKDYQFLLDGEAIKIDNTAELVERLQRELRVDVPGGSTTITNLRKGHAVRAGEDVTVAIFAVRNPPESFDQDFKRLQIRVTYESMYGEQWTYDSRDHLSP